MVKALFRTGLVLPFLVVPAAAIAGGFEFPDNVTRAVGRGGAYAAAVDDASALYFNPAGLTRVDGGSLTLDINLIDMNQRFERDPFSYGLFGSEDPRDQVTIEYEPVENDAGIFPAPMLFAADDFGMENWAFGLGVYGPSAVGISEWPTMSSDAPVPSSDNPRTDADESVVVREGGQSYMITSEAILLVYPSLSIAHEFPKLNLSVGVTLQAAMNWVHFEMGVDGDGSLAGQEAFESFENAPLFTPNTLETFGVAPSGIIGVMWDPKPQWAGSLSWRPAFSVPTTGSISVSIPDQLAGVELGDTEARLTNNLPDVVRFGVLYRHLPAGASEESVGREKFNIEADVVWERWEVLEAFDVELDGRLMGDTYYGEEGRELPNITMVRNYENTISFRLGGDIGAFRDPSTGDGLTLSLGGFYETAASPEAYTNLDFTSFERMSGSVGTSWRHGRLRLDGAFSYIHSPERVVDNGDAQLSVPLWICSAENRPDFSDAPCDARGDDVPSHAVNNGTYNVSYAIFSLGATVDF